MCIILIGNITLAQHKLALAQNGDGFSLYTQDQGVIKSPSDKEVKKALGKFGIWHYRIATSGEVTNKNVHPFQICGGKYLLYHNGIIGAGLDDLSDTHALAKTLKDVPIHCARTVISSLSTSNRFVIASASEPHEFFLYGKWECEAGVLMSHKLYTYATTLTKQQTFAGGTRIGTSHYDLYRE